MDCTIPHIEEMIRETRNSSFNKNCYHVNIRFNEYERFIKSFELYTNYEQHNSKEIPTPKEFFERAIPGFQRNNDKWTQEMQIKFVENILNGADTTIKLFSFSEQEDRQIIDGLQRLTAIIDFMHNKFSITLSYKDIDNKEHFQSVKYDDIKDVLRMFNTHLSISVYTFDNWNEVAKYYVDMNKNITHSEADIQKALKWFKEEKGVVLHGYDITEEPKNKTKKNSEIQLIEEVKDLGER